MGEERGHRGYYPMTWRKGGSGLMSVARWPCDPKEKVAGLCLELITRVIREL